MSDTHQPDKPHSRVSFWQTLKSTAAAAFGVQSDDVRERDFNHGSPASFIIAGLVFTLIFVVVLLVIVNLVLSNAG